MCDSEGQVEWLNDRWYEVTGLSEAESLARGGTLNVVHPDDHVLLWRRWDNAVSTSVTVEMDYRIRTRTGEWRWYFCRISPNRNARGEVIQWVGTAIDTHDRHLAEVALRKSADRARAHADELWALMDAVPAAVWLTRDSRCEEIVGNRAAHELFRIHPGGVIPDHGNLAGLSHFRIFAGGEELAEIDQSVRRAARGEALRNLEEEIRFENGDILHLYGSAVPLRDSEGVPRGAVAAFVDVTRLKQAEEALLEADRRKDEFLALLSHELRNPLMPILTAAQLLKPHLQGEAARELDVIHRQATHLAGLVDDLIDVSRVAHGKVTITRRTLEISGVVFKALEAVTPIFDVHKHRVTIDVAAAGLLVEADEGRLTQVFSNLLSNASRYTPMGGEIMVRGYRSGNWVVVTVRDTGVGIKPGLLSNVFELFVQGERGPDRSEGGLGLGLPLARTLTELHGGKLSVTSEGVGKGSEFTVRLPVAKTAVPLRCQTSPGAPGSCRDDASDPETPLPRVLIVDDNRDVADMLALLIGRSGYETRTAYDPLSAIEIADRMRPQVVILDIGLPMMDGYTLGRELRALLGEDAPSLVALTGYGQEGDRRKSEEARFARHLVKPVDSAQLVGLIEQLVTEREQRVAGGFPPVAAEP
jgi:PAS domain S-box-containing protein